MSKQPVLIIGASGHGKVIADIFENGNSYFIAGFIDEAKEIQAAHAGYTVLGNETHIPEILLQFPSCKLFIAVGDNWVRHSIYERITQNNKDFEFASAVHPNAQIAHDVTIGIGVAIMAGVVINSSTDIGDFAIINTKSSVDHDCSIGKFSSLAPGVILGGDVQVGNYTAISIGAIISHGIAIGNHNVIGAGSLLLENCEDNSILFGVPAKNIRKREVGEKYL